MSRETASREIQEIVTLEAAAMNPSKVIRTTQNFRHRVELCRIKTGGHFEAEIKKIHDVRFFISNFHS